MTPLIFEIIEEITVNSDGPFEDISEFKDWIEQQRQRMRLDHELRFELRQFSVYSKNPETYFRYVAALP